MKEGAVGAMTAEQVAAVDVWISAGAAKSGAASSPMLTPSSSGANRSAVGTKISARLGSLAGRLVTTASATYARIGIGSVEAKVLFELEGASMTGSQIAKGLGMDRAAVSRAVKSLKARGLLAGAQGSATSLSLTEEGAALRRCVVSLCGQREARLFEGFSSEERALVVGYLDRLATNVPQLAELGRETRRSKGAGGGR